MADIVVVQRVLPHYRAPFFRAFEQALARDGHSLTVVYGQERQGTVPRSIDVDEPWAVRIHNRYISFGKTDLVWQPCARYTRHADLVIVEQANRLLVNYLLLLKRRLTRSMFAYWGHGRNFQTIHSGGLRERWKRALLCAADWWFAYTEISKLAMESAGVQGSRITVVNNTIDADELMEAVRSVTPQEISSVLAKLGIQSGNIGLYCGGMYTDKHLPFLISACKEIRTRIPDFEMVAIGDGPEQGVIEVAAHEYPWIHYLGAVYGPDRAKYFAIAKVLLMPGLVGLAIVDSFAAGVPMFTSDVPIHSPEIAYLENGKNGVLTAHDVHEYAGSVAGFLQSPAMHQQLVDGCRQSARDFSVTRMAERFAAGVVRCLKIHERKLLSGREITESKENNNGA